MSTSLLDWLAAHPSVPVQVVSPHLDDAVLSCHALLSGRMAPRCRVTTVFTEADPQGDSAWARATGFRDAQHEHEVRRQEDRTAMRALGLVTHHAGLHPGTWSDAAARALATGIARAAEGSGADGLPLAAPLVLLPAAAGRPLAAWQRALRRLTRTPTGSDGHPEHRIVRDRLVPALAVCAGVRVGFYAELPYLWTDSVRRLQGELEALAGTRLAVSRLRPDAAAKRDAVAAYASQLVPIVGARPPYQRRVLSLPECYWLPVA